MSLVFYAMRTSGAIVSFDQILEFAAIRTDAAFNESDRFNARSGLLPHIVPSPAALLDTRIESVMLTDPSAPSHYQMIRLIRKKLAAWSPSTFLGFNSIARDEHFLRQALYQTLHHPYLTNCDGNTRTDIARIIQASRLFAPKAMIVPRASNGQLEIDLPSIASANGLSYDRTCNAICAAETMVQLGRRLNDQAPELWSTAMRFSKKAAVIDFIENEPVFSLSDFFYGKPYSWLVTLIGTSDKNITERYVFNLGVNPTELFPMSDAELQFRLTEVPKPVRILRVNAAPILTTEAEAPLVAAGRDLDVDELNQRARFLQADDSFRARLIDAFKANQEPRTPSPFVEEQIYDSFPSDHDRFLMEQFHQVPWSKRPVIVSQFKDVRLKQIGRRLIHFERPDLLESKLRQNIDREIANRLLGTDREFPWLTAPMALAQLDQILMNASRKDIPFLHGHRTHLTGRIAHAKRLAQLPSRSLDA